MLERFKKRRAFAYAGLAIVAAGGTFTVSTASEKARALDAERRRVDELREKTSEQDRALRGLEARMEDLEAEEQRERRRNVLEEKRLLDEIERLRAHEVAQTAQQVSVVEARVQLLRELADRAQLEEDARRVDIRLIHRELVEPTVRVNARSEVGSGSVVSSKLRGGKIRTLVLTAWHIVKDNVTETTPTPIEVDIYDASGKPRETRSMLVAHNEALDLALLEIEDEKAPATTARLARPQDVARASVFSKVYAIGCPLGYAPMPTSGDLTSLAKELDGITYWMTNAPTIFGNSGGGIYFAETRQLVGVLSRISAYKNLIDVAVPHMGIVTPIALVYDWLDTTEFAFIHKEALEPESSLLNASHPTGSMAESPPGTMKRIAAANVLCHLVGLALGATLMRPGSITEPLAARSAHLATHPLGWQVGWGVWMLSALAFVAFMEQVTRREPAARLALVLGAMGASVDLLCDSVQMLVLPLAASGDAFLAWERAANAGGLVVANGLYSVAVLVAALALPGRAARAAGALTFTMGLVMVAGGLADAPSLVVLSAGPTILAYCAWVALATREAR